MSTVPSIITAHKGRAGSRGSWRVEKACDSDHYRGQEYELWHYGTRMLLWRESMALGVEILDYDTGYGSVSDQGGMNKAFRTLCVPYRFDRAGGADIVDITEQLERVAPGHYMLSYRPPWMKGWS